MNNINLETSFQKLKTSLNTKYMLIETQVQQTRTVEIKLPFYSKARTDHYYMITESEDTIWVYASKNMATITAMKKDAGPSQSNYEDAIKGTEITAKEFWDAYYKARDILEEVYPNPLAKLQKQNS